MRHDWRDDRSDNEPKRLPPATPDLSAQPWPLRVAATVRFILERLEQAISPGGGLRRCLLLCLGVGIVVGAACLILLPLGTVILGCLAHWAALVCSICASLLQAVVSLLLLAGLVFVAWELLKAARRKQKKPPEEK